MQELAQFLEILAQHVDKAQFFIVGIGSDAFKPDSIE